MQQHRTARRGVVEADVDQPLRLRVRVNAHAVQRAHRVRARELHARLGVDDDHTVADARRALHLDLVDVERKRAVGDHAGEAVEHVEVRALELARAPREGHRLFTRHDPDEAVGTAHRDDLHPHPVLRSERGGVAADDVARSPAPRVQGTFDFVDNGADEVLRVVGLPGDRTHLGEHDEPMSLFARDRREQQEIGERQVGEVAPRRDEPLHVHEVGARQGRTCEREVFERAHGVGPVKR